jgi:hypothetical protein
LALQPAFHRLFVGEEFVQHEAEGRHLGEQQLQPLPVARMPLRRRRLERTQQSRERGLLVATQQRAGRHHA